MIFLASKGSLSLFSKFPPMSNTGGKPTARRRMKVQAHYCQPHQLGIQFEVPSRSNNTLSRAMRTNTMSGPCCGRGGTRMCWSLQIFFIPFAESLVSSILSCIWYSNTATTYTGTSKMRWSSWTSPFLVQCTDTPSRSSESLNRRSETLDLQIWSKGKASTNLRT